MFPEAAGALAVLSAMITPAVLISACGTLILSTSHRLARVVDRVRDLSRTLEELFEQPERQFAEARRDEVERQLLIQSRRGRLLQRSLSSFYVALGLFVGTTVSIGLLAYAPRLRFVPGPLGMVGTLTLLYGCMLLLGETRLALRSVDLEMEFVIRLKEMFASKGDRR
jgi:uncharacterized protein DUF2721